MGNRRSRRSCYCARSSLPFSSALFFLSIVLPTSSFAQLTDPATPPISSPTTLLTSATLSPSVTSSNPISSGTFSDSPPPASSSSSAASNEVNEHVFNYYFLIIAVIAVVFCVGILYIGRRKKRKAAMIRSQSQRALARDVEGFRTRFGIGRMGGSSNVIHGVREREDGLDDRGVAPPPYRPGSKPPSLRSTDVRRPDTSDAHSAGEEVELRTTSRRTNEPPGYHDHQRFGTAESVAGVTRPNTAVTPSERLGSMRRLLGNTGSSSQI